MLLHRTESFLEADYAVPVVFLLMDRRLQPLENPINRACPSRTSPTAGIRVQHLRGHQKSQ